MRKLLENDYVYILIEDGKELCRIKKDGRKKEFYEYLFCVTPNKKKEGK